MASIQMTNGHMGDCFWQCVALSRMTGHHHLYVPPHYTPDFAMLMSGTNVHVHSNEQAPAGTADGWIANARYEAKGIKWEHQNDIMGFVRSYMNAQAASFDHEPIFNQPEDMLASFPSLKPLGSDGGVDILCIDSNPMSGQCPRYSEEEMRQLLNKLRHRYRMVTVAYRGLMLPAIGRIAARAKLVIGVATGPWWPVMSIYAKDVPKVVMLDPQVLDYGQYSPVAHHGLVSGVEEWLKTEGWL